MTSIKPCRIRGVRYFEPVLEERPCKHVVLKAAEVQLDWWGVFDKYERRSLYVSLERAKQFEQQVAA